MSATSEYVVHKGPYPELTLPAVLVGYGLGVLISLSIGYGDHDAVEFS